jgi:hypothetical protein
MPPDVSPPPFAPTPKIERPRFQFSLRLLLAAVTIVAVLLGLGAFLTGQLLLGLMLAVLLRGVIPTMAVVTAFYGRGDLRAFAIGAVVVCVPTMTTDLGRLGFGDLVVGTVAQFVAIGFCGFVAVGVRRWLERHGLSNGR